MGSTPRSLKLTNSFLCLPLTSFQTIKHQIFRISAQIIRINVSMACIQDSPAPQYSTQDAVNRAHYDSPSTHKFVENHAVYIEIWLSQVEASGGQILMGFATLMHIAIVLLRWMNCTLTAHDNHKLLLLILIFINPCQPNITLPLLDSQSIPLSCFLLVLFASLSIS